MRAPRGVEHCQHASRCYGGRARGFRLPPVIPNLLKILRESVKAVPAMKYALAAAGLLAVVALAGALRLSPQAAVFGGVVTLVLMVALVIFARLTTTASRHFLLPVTIMMWAFLVLTIATAFVLFTSAFFGWPRSLRDVMEGRAASEQVRAPDEPTSALAAARQQRASRDFEGAWRSMQAAVAAAPDSPAVRAEQAKIAMAWVRAMRLREGESFAAAVAPLTDVLHARAAETAGAELADVQAHLGWANFLRYREGVRGLEIEEAYKRATALDPDNPFAHAMWGHWLATQRRPVDDVEMHFRAALRGDRERQYVQELRIAALDWLGNSDASRALIRVANEARLSGDSLSAELRRKVAQSGYGRLARNHDDDFLNACPPQQNLETFRWVCDPRELEQSPIFAYILARLTEANGQLEAAAGLYRALVAGESNLRDRAAAGLARCEAALGRRLSARAALRD